MTFIFASWPVGWSRQQRSTLAMAAAAALLLVLLWLIAIPLAAAPEPIAANAQIFADGTRTTVADAGRSPGGRAAGHRGGAGQARRCRCCGRRRRSISG